METNKVAIANRMGESTGYPLVWGGAVFISNMHVATERITGECFLVEVDHRDAATLLPLIQQHIRPGSIIYSDEWKAYSRITATTGMSHESVNHSLHFVTWLQVHTHRVWKRCKRLMREGRTMHSNLFDTYTSLNSCREVCIVYGM